MSEREDRRPAANGSGKVENVRRPAARDFAMVDQENRRPAADGSSLIFGARGRADCQQEIDSGTGARKKKSSRGRGKRVATLTNQRLITAMLTPTKSLGREDVVEDGSCEDNDQ